MSASAAPEEWVPPPKPKQSAFFCKMCGKPLELRIPASEHEWRHACTECGFIDYINPKMVVGCIVEHEGRVLMCRRAIEPCRGLWTLPAGFMEIGESSQTGAARETKEEALANVTITAPFSHFDIPGIGQAYLLFRASLAAPYTYGPGVESLEVQWVTPDAIPFDEVAFSSIKIALRLYEEEYRNGRQFGFHHGRIQKQPGSSPNDPSAFVLHDYLRFPTASGT